MSVNVVFALIVLLLLGFGLLTGNTIPTFSQQATDGDNLTEERAPVIPQHIVATDPKTWPSGDRVWDCCRAIAREEGYQVPGSVPGRLNNPGDISDGANKFGSEAHSGSSVTTFPDAGTGWQWLYTKLMNGATGQSHVYLPSLSWYQVGAIWAPPNADAWAENVAAGLGVDPGDTWSDYILG